MTTQLAGLVDSIRIHGKASAEDMAAKKYDNDPRYLNMRIGVNSRLDAIQAAILSEKLKIYPDELQTARRHRCSAIQKRSAATSAPFRKSLKAASRTGRSTRSSTTIATA